MRNLYESRTTLGRRNLNLINDMGVIPELDEKGLRNFGLKTGLIFIALFGLFLPIVFRRPLPLWPWGIAFFLGFPALFLPVMLKPIYFIWMKVGLALGWINTRIILSIIFYIVIFPIGLLMRMAGPDKMSRKFDREIGSYRTISNPISRNKMEVPF